MTGTVRVDLRAARRLLCWYGAFVLLLAPRLPAPACPWRRLTGRRCPACGLSTAVAVALHGRVRHAATLHRLGPVTAAAVLVAGVMTLAGAVRRGGRGGPVRREGRGRDPVGGGSGGGCRPAARRSAPRPVEAVVASGAGAEAADRGRPR